MIRGQNERHGWPRGKQPISVWRSRAAPGKAAAAQAAARLTSLLWEQLWPALLAPGPLVGIFLILALLDVLPLMPPWLHVLLVLAFLLAIAGFLYRGLRRVKLPDQAAVYRRLEQDSGLRHRPLATLEDQPASPPGRENDPAIQAYWALHRRRLQAQLDKLRVSPPRASWSRIDSRGLRAMVALPLIIMLVVAGSDWDDRLCGLWFPARSPWRRCRHHGWTLGSARLPILAAAALSRSDRWRRAPGAAGSRLLAQVQEASANRRSSSTAACSPLFQQVAENVFRTETLLEASGDLIEQRGSTLGA